MNKSTFFYLLLLSLVCFAVTPRALAEQAVPKLQGKLMQGSLIRGETKAGSKVWLNDKVIRVSSDGYFVMGFGRDAALTHTLSWQHQHMPARDSMQLVLQKREYKIERIEGVPSKYVSPPKAVLDRIRQENTAIAKARKTNSELRDFLSELIMPAKGRISGVYGSQRFFNGEPKRPHYGLDIANKTGEPVVAPIGGVVSLAHDDMYYSGGTLIIDHGFGVSSTFIHLDKIHVKVGQRVEQGERIADIGATGRVTGSHLDWRINWFGTRVDPALLVD
ncbi:M23 family metallopeptidase [Agaribacter flavus]|uniref:M23 family metallopeptidase n=1 Tax=Agaribacter flavus TaxID=1902781 RepID=A0ABV7FII7_9ALTE